MNIIPLHGLGDDWEKISSQTQEFHERYPGYLTTKSGPTMEEYRLDEICKAITDASGLPEEHNKSFHGDPGDSSLFVQIIRDELQQWRLWEDRNHVAFLTPFPSVPGFTVVVPRSHLSSDIFSLEDGALEALVTAAHEVAQHLMTAFKARRCGIFFEGFEIDYAHVKLLPVHREEASATVPVEPFCDKYLGYVTTKRGPKPKLPPPWLTLTDEMLAKLSKERK